MRALFGLLFLGTSACTTIHGVSGSATPGEVYVLVKKYPLPQGYVLRCTEKTMRGGDLTMCTRVLNFAEAGQVGPSGDSSGVFTRSLDE